MFLSRNMKNNVYHCKPQFYCIKMRFKGVVGLYWYVFVMRIIFLVLCFVIVVFLCYVHLYFYHTCSQPRWLSWMRVRLVHVIRWLRVRRYRVGIILSLRLSMRFSMVILSLPMIQWSFFRVDHEIFYGHSLPSADSRRAVVSFWRKNVHNTG